MILHQPSEHFAFGHSVRRTRYLDDHVLLPKSGLFSRGMRSVLADMFDKERHLLRVESACVAGLLSKIFEKQPTRSHATHLPRADASRDVRFAAPTRRQCDIELL